jgi:tight adherence protein C
MLQELLNKVKAIAIPPELVAAVLSFAAVLFMGTLLLTAYGQIRRVSRRTREKGLNGDSAPSAPQPELVRLLERMGNFVSHGRATTSLWEQLVRAGYMNRNAPAIYTGVKLILFVVGLSIGAALVTSWDATLVKKVWAISLSGAALFFLPNVVVRMQEQKRRQEIRQYLPDAVDLLEVCVSSGIGLDMAWNMVADEIHHVSPVLGSAMDLSNFEMHLGASRTEAMRNMATRTGAEQLASLAAILVQSERFGTSVALALAEFADWMRDERRLHAEEEAEKLPTKLLIPMVLFIFPAIMVVAMGPAILHIQRLLVNQ